jgi:hypothetical protein
VRPIEFRAQRGFPRKAKLDALGAIAKLVGAFPAHAHDPAGASNRLCEGEFFEPLEQRDPM